MPFPSFTNPSLFTPLEQFADARWFWNSSFESIDISTLSIFSSARELDAWSLYTTGLGTSQAFGSVSLSFFDTILFARFLLGLWLVAYPSYAGSYASTVSVVVSYAPHSGFLLAGIHLLTGGFLTLWFHDLYVPVTFGSTTVGQFLPTFDFSLGLDENRVTLILAFFLVGGSEEEEDEDFLLSSTTDLDVVEEVVAPLFVANLGKDVADNGALYLKVCAVFGFVIANNLRGRIPYADTATSSLGLTFWVALATFTSLLTLRIGRHGISYLFGLFRPSGCPFPLLFLLIPIEFISYSFRLVSLSVRLFANRRAGHTLRKVLIGFSYTRFLIGDRFLLAGFLPALVIFVLIFLERTVAAIQAYIFTVLVCLYLKDIFVAH